MGPTSKSNSAKKLAFERKLRADGSSNPKYVDVLEVDKPLSGQNFGCFSFISPDKILKQKEMYFFDEFLKKWEFTKSMEKFSQFLNFISYKYKLSFEDLSKDFEDFVKEEKEELLKSAIEDDYKTFLDHHEDELTKQFNIKHNFQTNVRAFKSRGNFATQEEAEIRAKMLRELDPSFDIFVGPIGQWLPWDPEGYKTGRIEYMEEELNQLVHNKVENEKIAKAAFEQRVKETKQKAIEDNVKSAEKTGAALTQTIDEQGNLIGVNNTTVEKTLNQVENLSVADIRNELFEGENIVTNNNK